jgi:hypothetical protein
MTTGRANDTRRNLWYYPAYSPSGKLASGPPNNYTRSWYYTAPFKPNACDTHVKGDGRTFDEFPFFTTNQAVDLTLPDKSLRADVRLTRTGEGSIQGNDLGAIGIDRYPSVSTFRFDADRWTTATRRSVSRLEPWPRVHRPSWKPPTRRPGRCARYWRTSG